MEALSKRSTRPPQTKVSCSSFFPRLLSLPPFASPRSRKLSHGSSRARKARADSHPFFLLLTRPFQHRTRTHSSNRRLSCTNGINDSSWTSTLLYHSIQLGSSSSSLSRFSSQSRSSQSRSSSPSSSTFARSIQRRILRRSRTTLGSSRPARRGCSDQEAEEEESFGWSLAVPEDAVRNLCRFVSFLVRFLPSLAQTRRFPSSTS